MTKIAKILMPVDLVLARTRETMSETPPPGQNHRKHGRGTAWVFIEMLCAFLAVAGVNMMLADGRAKKERLAHANDAFKYHVQEKWDTMQWVDQHGVAEDSKTAEQSIQERVHHIKTDTQDTAISQMFYHITKLARNVWLPHLRTLLDGPGCQGQVPPARVLRVCPARTGCDRRTEQRLPPRRPRRHAKGARRWRWLSQENACQQLRRTGRRGPAEKAKRCYLHAHQRPSHGFSFRQLVFVRAFIRQHVCCLG